MKKKLVKPELKVITIQSQSIMAASLTGNTGSAPITSGGSTSSGGFGGVQAKKGNFIKVPSIGAK